MKCSAFWLLALLSTLAAFEVKSAPGIPNRRAYDPVLQNLERLDKFYSAISRPRFGKRTEAASNYPIDDDYENQMQAGDSNEWLLNRR